MNAKLTIVKHKHPGLFMDKQLMSGGTTPKSTAARYSASSSKISFSPSRASLRILSLKQGRFKIVN
jgi:hypothetical protein